MSSINVYQPKEKVSSLGNGKEKEIQKQNYLAPKTPAKLIPTCLKTYARKRTYYNLLHTFNSNSNDPLEKTSSVMFVDSGMESKLVENSIQKFDSLEKKNGGDVICGVKLVSQGLNLNEQPPNDLVAFGSRLSFLTNSLLEEETEAFKEKELGMSSFPIDVNGSYLHNYIGFENSDAIYSLPTIFSPLQLPTFQELPNNNILDAILKRK